MKVMEIGEDWDFEHIRPAERPDPRPGPGQVLLRMRAATLNYRDALIVRRGYGRQSGSLPLIPLSDGVGQVIELGAGVERVALGDRVCPIMNQLWHHGPFRAGLWPGYLGGPLDGVMREFIVLDQDGVVPVPGHLSDLQAAALPCAGLTAWSAIAEAGALKAGDQVLIQGTGGVSLFALQFAKAQGAQVIAISSSDDKLARLTALGADQVINYRQTPEWGKAAAALTQGRGVDLVVEIGGAETFAQSLRALRPSGTIALVGNITGSLAQINLPHIFMKAARLVGVVLGNRESFEAMVRALDLHRLQPVIDPNVYGFEDLRAALEALPLGRHLGKVGIEYWISLASVAVFLDLIVDIAGTGADRAADRRPTGDTAAGQDRAGRADSRADRAAAQDPLLRVVQARAGAERQGGGDDKRKSPGFHELSLRRSFEICPQRADGSLVLKGHVGTTDGDATAILWRNCDQGHTLSRSFKEQ